MDSTTGVVVIIAAVAFADVKTEALLAILAARVAIIGVRKAAAVALMAVL
ncbi:hypothetical protein [Paraburkholderia tropica]|nr:hypothetical protein [Paraburkholderia tropica]